MSADMEWYYRGYFCWLNAIDKTGRKLKQDFVNFMGGVRIPDNHPCYAKGHKEPGFTDLGERYVRVGWYYGAHDVMAMGGHWVGGEIWGAVIQDGDIAPLIKRINKMVVALERIQRSEMYVDKQGNICEVKKIKGGS